MEEGTDNNSADVLVEKPMSLNPPHKMKYNTTNTMMVTANMS